MNEIIALCIPKHKNKYLAQVYQALRRGKQRIRGIKGLLLQSKDILKERSLGYYSYHSWKIDSKTLCDNFEDKVKGHL